MRLAFRLPELKEKLRSGELTMTAISKLEAHARAQKIADHEILKLAEACIGKSVREVEKLISPDPKMKLTIEVDDELLVLLEELKQLSHTTSISEILRGALKARVKELRKSREEKTKSEIVSQTPDDHSKPAAKEKSRYIPKALKRKLFTRAGQQCEYQSPITKLRCTEKSQLQIQHHIPFAKGGLNTIENLAIYCQAHNLYAAIKDFPLARTMITARKIA
jgi:5-methylcytosine-specific restriction endonuclease McrA